MRCQDAGRTSGVDVGTASSMRRIVRAAPGRRGETGSWSGGSKDARRQDAAGKNASHGRVSPYPFFLNVVASVEGVAGASHRHAAGNNGGNSPVVVGILRAFRHHPGAREVIVRCPVSGPGPVTRLGTALLGSCRMSSDDHATDAAGDAYAPDLWSPGDDQQDHRSEPTWSVVEGRLPWPRPVRDPPPPLPAPSRPGVFDRIGSRRRTVCWS